MKVYAFINFNCHFYSIISEPVLFTKQRVIINLINIFLIVEIFLNRCSEVANLLKN